MDKGLIEPIPGWEKSYLITRDGQVWSISYNKWRSLRVKDGYYYIRLLGEGKDVTISVHRLVALTFLPNPDNKPQVNHIDGNKLNNHVSNLEWCTNGENQIHAHRNNLQPTRKGENNGNNKLTQSDVDYIRSSNLKRKQIKEKFPQVSLTTIDRILKYASWKKDSE